MAPSAGYEDEFLAAVRISKAAHSPWVDVPEDSQQFRDYLKKTDRPSHLSFFLLCDGVLSGVVNVSEIVMGNFLSGFLGYYMFTPFEGKGVMSSGLAKVVSYSFSEVGLNRLEANIQPENHRSIKLVKGLGFRLEGKSERYLKIGDHWKDHERWAIHSKEWRDRGAA